MAPSGSDTFLKPFANSAVMDKFESYPVPVRRQLMRLRNLIFETADSIAGVGEIEETLKWGEPAYLTSESKMGTTVRLGWKKSRPSQYAMYFHCQTNLVETFRTLFPDGFDFEGNRAILFEDGAPIAEDALRLCIASALTYHRDRKARAGR